MTSALMPGASGGVGVAIAPRLAPDPAVRMAGGAGEAIYDLPFTTGAVPSADGGRPLGAR